MINKLILLVEDNPDDEELTIDVMRSSGVKAEIRVMRDGAEAAEFLSSPETHPSLILLDLKLPKLSGFEVLRRIRANPNTRLTPTVVLTSSSENCDIADSYKLGASSYVRKPVEYDDFVRAVQVLGVYWLKVNETPGEFL